MKKVVFSTFFCSLIFIIYIWSWLSWYTWTAVTNGKELSGCADAVEKHISLCSGCVSQKKGQREFQNRQDRRSLSGKSCLESARLYGVAPAHAKYLTIGIPSVDRKKGRYLFKTLKSLISNLDEDERNNVTIVVLIGDSDGPLRSKRANETYYLFQKEVNSGLVLVIEPIAEFYPMIEITRRTFNDSLDRVRWRSKQVLDFAFLLHCARDSSEYFLILEDDVESSPSYVKAVKDFILEKKGEDWISLTFSGFFIIGRLLRNEDLSRLSDFLVMFYLEKPVDLLIVQFLDLLVQDRYTVTRRIPGLFQHIGLFSSLGGKLQKAKDRSFSSSGRSGNPPADVVTTLGVYKNHFPEHCYASSPEKFFWGSAPKANDTLDIVLHRPLWLRKLTVVSGHPSHKNDFIRSAELKLSRSFKQMVTNSKADCADFRTVALFRGGIVDIAFDNNPQEMVVQCIRIEFLKKQSNWILIREITVRGKPI